MKDAIQRLMTAYNALFAVVGTSGHSLGLCTELPMFLRPCQDLAGGTASPSRFCVGIGHAFGWASGDGVEQGGFYGDWLSPGNGDEFGKGDGIGWESAAGLIHWMHCQETS